jgi:hypothetical protein
MKGMVAARWIVLVCVGLGLLGAGCSSDLKPTNAKLEKGLNDYLNGHSECLFPSGRNFPYEVTPGAASKADKKRMDALKDAGLLKEEDDFETHVARYTLTPAGQRFSPRFCYGHKQVSSIDGFTPPVQQGNVLQTTVSYHATMTEIPVWVRTDQMEAAFPEMAANISGPQPGQIVMGTAGVGWSVR